MAGEAHMDVLVAVFGRGTPVLTVTKRCRLGYEALSKSQDQNRTSPESISETSSGVSKV